jgi:hypothetical protein
MIGVAEAGLKRPRVVVWLRTNNPNRVLHREKKEEFALYDQIVLGVVNEENTAGVFNKKTLANVQE